VSSGTENEKLGTCSTLGGAHLEPGAGHHGIGSDRLGGWISLGALVVFLIVFLITVERSFPTWLIFLVGIGVPAVLFLISAYGDNNRQQLTADSQSPTATLKRP
jgi:hypothetical protein